VRGVGASPLAVGQLCLRQTQVKLSPKVLRSSLSGAPCLSPPFPRPAEGVVTESQNSRGWKGPLWVTQPNHLPKQGNPEQAAEDLVQVGLNISREGDSTASLGSLARALSPSEGRSSSSCSAGASCASVCARCPLSCRWAPLKRVWPHPPDTHPADICKHL